jgi:hypothetical protein
MAPFASPSKKTIHISIRKEGQDSAISCKGDGHRLLGCRGVYSGQISGTWANQAPYALRDKRSGRNIIFLHDSAHPHAAHLTLEAIAKMGWKRLPHPSNSPVLVHSIFSDF